MFVKEYKDGNYYVFKRINNRGRKRKDDMKITNILSIGAEQHIHLGRMRIPVKFMGKKIRFKLEEIL